MVIRSSKFYYDPVIQSNNSILRYTIVTVTITYHIWHYNFSNIDFVDTWIKAWLNRNKYFWKWYWLPTTTGWGKLEAAGWLNNDNDDDITLYAHISRGVKNAKVNEPPWGFTVSEEWWWTSLMSAIYILLFIKK